MTQGSRGSPCLVGSHSRKRELECALWASHIGGLHHARCSDAGGAKQRIFWRDELLEDEMDDLLDPLVGGVHLVLSKLVVSGWV